MNSELINQSTHLELDELGICSSASTTADNNYKNKKLIRSFI